MLTKTFSQISRAAHVEVSVLVALQNVDVIHDDFTGFEGAETAARLNCEVKAYNSVCGKSRVTS
jgi:hypothetical protein